MDERLYERDFQAWAVQQAAALRARDWAALDLDHLAEEVEDLPKAVRHELGMALHYLLEWQAQPSPHEDARYYWREAILYHRDMMAKLLEDSPHLRPMLEAVLAPEYQWARRDAARRCKRPVDDFPETCPWTLDQVLDEEFWPEEGDR